MNLEPQRILSHLEKLIDRLSEKNEEYRKLGTAWAETDRAFRLAYAKKILKLKNTGTAVTLVRKIAEGEPDVSLAQYKMNCAQVEYSACLESMRNIREAIGAYRSFLTWLRAELHESGGVRI